MVQIVRAEEGHLDAFLDVVARVYNSGDPIPDDRVERPTSSRYVALLEGKVVGVYSLYEHDILIRGGVLRCGGVAGVAVPPESRDGGVGAAMMKAAVARMREDGFAIASLYAFREPFYAKAGYASVGRRLKIECPAHRLPKGGGLPVQRLGPDDWASLDPCYRSFATERNGMALRDAPRWKRVLGEHRPLVVYAVGDPIEGYAVVSHKTEFWSTDHVSEFVWSTPQGYAALLGVLRGLATNKRALSWFEPGDGPFGFVHLDEGVEISLAHPIMARMIDVKACLEACRPSGEGGFSFSTDEDREAWRVSFSGGRTTLERADTAEFSASVGTLTQALYGEPSLDALMRMGAVDGSPNEAAYRFFSPGSGYCLDYF